MKAALGLFLSGRPHPPEFQNWRRRFRGVWKLCNKYQARDLLCPVSGDSVWTRICGVLTQSGPSEMLQGTKQHEECYAKFNCRWRVCSTGSCGGWSIWVPIISSWYVIPIEMMATRGSRTASSLDGLTGVFTVEDIYSRPLHDSQLRTY